LWGIVSAAVYEAAKGIFLENAPGVQVTVTDTEVTYRRGNDIIIIKRDVYNDLPKVLAAPTAQENTLKIMKALERDPTVTDFGLTADMNDPVPVLTIPRSEIEKAFDRGTFTGISMTVPRMVEERSAADRYVTEKATLRITTAQLKGTNKKWRFEWGDKEISARITDEAFLAKLNNREYLIGAGDTLDVELAYKRRSGTGEGNGIDPRSFVVAKVFWKPELSGHDMKTGKDVKPWHLRLKDQP